MRSIDDDGLNTKAGGVADGGADGNAGEAQIETGALNRKSRFADELDDATALFLVGDTGFVDACGRKREGGDLGLAE